MAPRAGIEQEVRMTAVKILAIGALVIGAVVQSASAGPFSGTFNWISWNAGNGSVRNTGTSDPFSLAVSSPPTTPAPVVQPQAPVPTSSSMAPVYSPPVPAYTMSNLPYTPFGMAAVVSSPAPAAESNPVVAISNAAPVISAPVPLNVPSPISAMAASRLNVATATPVVYDAFVNLGSTTYPDAINLTSGLPQAWYNSHSQSMLNLFGGQPTAQQQADFNSTVLQRVEHTFDLAGVHVNLTDDPTAQAGHTLSVVSNTTSSWGPLLGLTNIGGNGFSFVDDAAKVSQSVDQLEWVVAHNVSHELMLAFGVAENYDKSGNYIDAELANLSMMLNPSATFSQGAASALLASQPFNTQYGYGSAYAQEVSPQPVPEPSTIAVWAIGAVGLVIARRARSRRAIA